SAASAHWSTAMTAQERAQQAQTEQLQHALAQMAQQTTALQDSVGQAVQQQLGVLADGFERSTSAAAANWQAALTAQEQAQQALTQQLQSTLAQL
uniref:DUF802 domain-containing protein n=2 Tax=Gammaproteobacteria TaxID=1236 RepID=UPI000F055420